MSSQTLFAKLKNLSELPNWEWPKDARQTIFEGLCSDDPVIQHLALTTTSFVAMDDSVAKALLNIIADDSMPEELRTQAAISLGPALDDYCEHQLSDESILSLSKPCFADVPSSMSKLYKRGIPPLENVPDLLEALTAPMLGGKDEKKDTRTFEHRGPVLSESCFETIQQVMKHVHESESTPKALKRNVLEISVRCPVKWHENAVLQAYRSEDFEWRVTAIFCMMYFPGFNREVLNALYDPSSEVRYQAVCAARNKGLGDAGPEIYRLAASSDTEIEIRLKAIDALAYLRPPGAYELLEELETSEMPDIAETAAEAKEEFLLGERLECYEDPDEPPPEDSDWQ